MHQSRRAVLGGMASAAALAAAPAAWARWEDTVRYPDPAIEILDPSFTRLRLFNAAVERLWTGARWTEGPVWFGDMRAVFWSDIPNNRILRWDEASGRVAEFRKPANFPARKSLARGVLPLGLAHGLRLVRPVPKDRSLTWDDVAVDDTVSAYRLRREMEAVFAERETSPAVA